MKGPDNGGKGMLRRALARIAATDEEIEAAHLQERALKVGAQPMASNRDRDRVCVAGTVRSVKLKSIAGAASLEAELYDGTGSVQLVFLGRRRIPGISAGRTMVARGRVSCAGGTMRMFNPSYELLPPGYVPS